MLVARTVGGLEAVDDQIKALGGSATLVPLDVTDGPGIDRLGAALYERYGQLDVLLGNAGILGTLSPVGHIEPTVFERVMAVNVTANWRLIRSLDPLLRQSDAGRAIFVTSGISRKAVPYWGAYAASKAALDMLVGIYAAEVAHTNVRVNLFNPGPMRTGAARPGLSGRGSCAADAARSACRGADSARPPVMHHDRPVGCGRRSIRRLIVGHQGLVAALMER